MLVRDIDQITNPLDFQILAGVPLALTALKAAGFLLEVVSNQPAVARGLITEPDLQKLHAVLEKMLVQAGAPRLDGWYFCPHHPHATLSRYRVVCDCRKPRPGMLLQAAREHGVDLQNSFLVGDRITDIIAGARAGCRTVLVQTGKHLEKPIETSEPLDPVIQPEHICADLGAATEWIIWKTRK